MRNKFFLLLILVIGFIFRFYQLGEIPHGIHRDEAFLGYNAYSLLRTRMDITGYVFPLHLESFLYSPAGYSYASMPFITLFGLSSFSTRFASAFFGLLTIPFLYLFVKELLRGEKFRTSVALIASFLLTINPWHINLSRTATENTLVTFCIVVAVLLFFVFKRSRKMRFLIGSFFLFLVSLFIYQAPRAFLPLFIPLLFLLFFNLSFNKIKLPLLLFFGFILLPTFLILSSNDLSLRIRTVSIFHDPEVQLKIDEHLREDGSSDIPSSVSRAFHNKLNYYGSEFLKNYFSHFSYSFLFTDTAFPDRYRVPSVGIMYAIELPLFLYGMFLLLKTKQKIGLFLLGWILISPIGSALTSDDIPNMQRTLFMYIPIVICVGYGIYNLMKFVSVSPVQFWGLTVFLTLTFSYSVMFYSHQYFVHVDVYRPWYRQSGYQELVKSVTAISSQYKRVVVTNRESAPTIFFLFHEKYDPKSFISETKDSTFRDYDRINFGKYEFSIEECPLKWVVDNGHKTLTGKKNVLYVNSGLCKDEDNIKVLKQIERSDGSVVYKIVVVNK